MKKFLPVISIAVVFLVVSLWFFVSAKKESLDIYPRAEFLVGKGAAQTGGIFQSCFSNCGTRLLILFNAGNGQAVVEVWDTAQQEIICHIQPGRLIEQMAFSPAAEEFILSHNLAGNRKMTVYRSKDGEKISSFPDLLTKDEYSSYAFMPDGDTVLALQSGDKISATIWSWWDARKIRLFPCDGVKLALSQDGTRMATGILNPNLKNVYNNVKIWDVEAGKPCCKIPLQNTDSIQMAFSPDNTQFVIGNWAAEVLIYDTETGRLIQSLRPFQNDRRGVTGLAYSHDGDSVAVCFSHNNQILHGDRFQLLIYDFYRIFRGKSSRSDHTAPVYLYNCQTWEPVHRFGLNQVKANAQFLPDGSRLVTVDSPFIVRVWDLPKR